MLEHMAKSGVRLPDMKCAPAPPSHSFPALFFALYSPLELHSRDPEPKRRAATVDRAHHRRSIQARRRNIAAVAGR